MVTKSTEAGGDCVRYEFTLHPNDLVFTFDDGEITIEESQ